MTASAARLLSSSAADMKVLWLTPVRKAMLLRRAPALLLYVS